jgi:hypothetical protein
MASNKSNDSRIKQGIRKRQPPLPIVWSPERSWRNRGGSEKKFLSSLERRYLRDVLWALERSNKPVSSEFVLNPQGDQSGCNVKLPAPLAKLVANGLVEVDKCGKRLSCILTTQGLEGIENWMLAKPPNFQLMFPSLYRQLTDRLGRVRTSGKKPIRRRRASIGSNSDNKAE